MNNVLKLVCILAVSLSVGCAKNMIIDEALLAGSTSRLTIEAPDLEGFLAIPLMSHRYVGVRMFTEEQACKDKFSYNSSDPFGHARLTGSSYTQTFMIPAEKRIFITTKVDENIGGNIKTCYGALEFLPEKNKAYTFNIEPFKLGVYVCKTMLTEDNVIEDLRIPPKHLKFYHPARWGGVDTNINCENVTRP